MFKKGTKLYAIFTGKCPKCHNESMYEDTNPYNIGNIYKMHEQCSHCKTKYKIEPSFFYGAMYVSYAVGCAVSIATFIIAYLFFGATLKNSFIAIVVTLLGLMPFIMRISRNIWVNVFIHYEEEASKKTEDK